MHNEVRIIFYLTAILHVICEVYSYQDFFKHHSYLLVFVDLYVIGLHKI